MGRDELKSKAEPGGFVEYGPEQLPKVDSMRRDKTQPDFFGVPILHDDQVLFTRAEELGGKPASCYTCKEQNPDKTCVRLGPGVAVKKLVGHRDSGDPIEYWPCCSMHEYGPGPDKMKFYDTLDNPNSVGLVWINAPDVGVEYGGANCGGCCGGDDCDHYMVGKGEKWDNPQGYCRILGHMVDAGDVCTGWQDDDILEWPDAQQLIRGDSLDTVQKKRLVRGLMGRDVDRSRRPVLQSQTKAKKGDD